MRLAILGAGTIARLVLLHVRRGALPGVRVCGLLCRPGSSRGLAAAAEFALPLSDKRESLLASKPDFVLEAASHEAVREHLVPILQAGRGVIVLSAGALADDALRRQAESAAEKSGATLYVPSGGIGGLDALKAACAAGVDEVSIQVAKPPAAWKGIAYVEERRFWLDGFGRALLLFLRPARGGGAHFPPKVKKPAVLSPSGGGGG